MNQGFESSVEDNWNYSSNQPTSWRWNIETSCMGVYVNYSPTQGSHLWNMAFADNHILTFDTVFLTGIPEVVLEFDYGTELWGGSLYYELNFDGIEQGQTFVTSSTVEGTVSADIPNNLTYMILRIAPDFVEDVGYIDNIMLFSNSTLPITLNSFTSEKTNNNSIVLQWETSMEVNNEYFEIQRSNNGRDFEVIGTVYGAVNSFVLISYQFEDRTATGPKVHYRLKQADLNGEYSMSPVITQKLTDSSVRYLSGNGYINIETQGLENTKWMLFDNQGKRINQILHNSDRSSIDTNRLASGIYYLKCLDCSDSPDTHRFYVN